MKPVMQTRVGVDPEAPGNCFTACVASILECDIADLPDEAKIAADIKSQTPEWEGWHDRFKLGRTWSRLWDETQAECFKRGFWMLEVSGPFDASPALDATWTIISAKSPRGVNHAVVGRGLNIVHDPHPEGGGVSADERTYIFFVAVDPTKVAA